VTIGTKIQRWVTHPHPHDKLLYGNHDHDQPTHPIRYHWVGEWTAHDCVMSHPDGSQQIPGVQHVWLELVPRWTHL
jgi:hypothetical protein